MNTNRYETTFLLKLTLFKGQGQCERKGSFFNWFTSGSFIEDSSVKTPLIRAQFYCRVFREREIDEVCDIFLHHKKLLCTIFP